MGWRDIKKCTMRRTCNCEWDAAVAHHPLVVDLVLGQLGDDDMRALDDLENWEDTSYYDKMKKHVFLTYQQVEAHKRFMEENPY